MLLQAAMFSGFGPTDDPPSPPRPLPHTRSTARTGWFSPFKPFDDCTAQWSPSPGAEPLAARGIALAATTPGATVVDSLCAGSPTSRECTVPCEASPEAGAAR